MNLGTNSAHAIEERGIKQGDYINISAEEYNAQSEDATGLPAGEYVHILFEDNGLGMPDDIKSKAFDPLFTTKEKGTQKGQGLGLAMVYNIITQKHNGHITIDSVEGKGTTFHIYLPKADPGEQLATEDLIETAGGHETILVIEDEKIIRNLVKRILKKYGYNVLTSSDGKKGLEVYKENKDSIDIILLDLTMPEMSGQMVFEEMLKIDPNVKVMISSGHGEEETRKGILSLAKGYVKKPYKIDELARSIRSILDS